MVEVEAFRVGAGGAAASAASATSDELDVGVLALAGGGAAVAAVDVDFAHGWGLVVWLDGWMEDTIGSWIGMQFPVRGSCRWPGGPRASWYILPVANDRSSVNHHLGARST